MPTLETPFGSNPRPVSLNRISSSPGVHGRAGGQSSVDPYAIENYARSSASTRRGEPPPHPLDLLSTSQTLAADRPESASGVYEIVYRQNLISSAAGSHESAPEKSTNSSLGSKWKYCVQPGQRQDAEKRRFRLQNAAAKLLPDEGVATCLRHIATGKFAVQLVYSEASGRAHYHNLQTCKNVWGCPVCAERITAKRRDDIAAALTAALQLGYHPVLITYTARHSQGDVLDKFLDSLLGAFRAFKSGSRFKAIKAEYGWIGSIRTLEPTYGANGWHPHFHELVFLSHELTPPLAEGLREWLSELWQSVLQRRGLNASDARGVKVQIADRDIAEYVAKFGHEPSGHAWTSADEMTRGPVKKTSKKGVTPFQLLEAYSTPADDLRWFDEWKCIRSRKRAGQLFQEYAAALKGRNQLVWSRGLRDLLALPAEVPDEAIDDQDDENDKKIVMASLPWPAWKVILKHELRAELRAVASTGDVAAVRAFLAALGLYTVDLSEFAMRPGRSP